MNAESSGASGSSSAAARQPLRLRQVDDVCTVRDARTCCAAGAVAFGRGELERLAGVANLDAVGEQLRNERIGAAERVALEHDAAQHTASGIANGLETRGDIVTHARRALLGGHAQCGDARRVVMVCGIGAV